MSTESKTPIAPIIDWVECPICGGCDMRRESHSDGSGQLVPLIFCTNHACRSNTFAGYDERMEKLEAELAEAKALIETDRAYTAAIVEQLAAERAKPAEAQAATL